MIPIIISSADTNSEGESMDTETRDRTFSTGDIYGPTGGINDKNNLHISLTSTASAGLMALGDISSVWNRKDNLGDVDDDIAVNIRKKFEMSRWLTFLDPEVEEEYMEKFFYGSINTYRIMFVLIALIFLSFNALLFLTATLLPIHVITNGCCFVVSIILHFLCKTKNFRNYYMKIIRWVILYYVGSVSIQRFFDDFDQDDVGMLAVPDARYLHRYYFFAYFAFFTSIPVPFKIGLQNIIIGMCMFIICISCFPNSSILMIVENAILMIVVTLPIISASYWNELNHRNQEARRAGILQHTEEVIKEKGVTEKLLLNILPNKIARRLMKGEDIISDGYGHVTVLFADIVGWTTIARSLSPVEAVELLGEIVVTFDRVTHSHRVEKIKTIGDGYLVGCGLPEAMTPVESARIMSNYALSLTKAMESFSAAKGIQVLLTVGIHTGPVVAGVIGKTKFLYDLWGDSVNVASRMQSHSEPGKIGVTSEFYEFVKDDFNFEKRPIMQVKGKGDMQTYFLLSKRASGDTLRAAEESWRPNTPRAMIDASDVGESQENVEPIPETKSKRKQRAKEVMAAKMKEVDEMLKTQVRSQLGILSYTKIENEEKYTKHEDELTQKRSVMFLGYILVVQILAGPDILLYDSSEKVIQLYYAVMSVSIITNAILLVISHFRPSFGHKASLFAVCILHASLLVLFPLYRDMETKAMRFVYFYLMIYSIVVFMASHIPYRKCALVIYGSFLIFTTQCFAVNLDVGIDPSGLLIYICLLVFGHITAREIENHARLEFLLSLMADEERKHVIQQREESERLLFNILPESVIRKMREGDGKMVELYANTSVLFADVVGFTVLSSKLNARSIVSMLNELFSKFDTLGEELGMEKIKTIGDAYMAVCGLPYPREDHARVAVKMGLGMIRIVDNLPEIEGLKVRMRIGVHSGPVVGGLIGLKKMVFDIWGENVNVASKMESYGTPGFVNISHITVECIGQNKGLVFEDRHKTVTIGNVDYHLSYVKLEENSSLPNAPNGNEKHDW